MLSFVKEKVTFLCLFVFCLCSFFALDAKADTPIIRSFQITTSEPSAGYTAGQTVSYKLVVYGWHCAHTKYGYTYIFNGTQKPSSLSGSLAQFYRKYADTCVNGQTSTDPNTAGQTYTFTGTIKLAVTSGVHYLNAYHCVDEKDKCTSSFPDPQDATKSTTFLSYNIENQTPVLSSLPSNIIEVKEGDTVSFEMSAYDLDQDTLTWTVTGIPTGASVSPGNGASGSGATPGIKQQFTWTPSFTDGDSTLGYKYYSVYFKATDNGTPVKSKETYIFIKVLNVNQVPSISNAGIYTINEGDKLSVTINASDKDPSDQLTWTVSNVPTGASVSPGNGSVSTQQVFTWTPDSSASSAGTTKKYEVTFQVADNGSPTQSATTKLTIYVKDVNRAPVFVSPGNQSVLEGQLLSFVVQATDPDNDNISWSVSGSPAGSSLGSPDSNGKRTFFWTPNTSQAGTYSVTFTAKDDGVPSLSASVTIVITVTNSNRAPVILLSNGSTPPSIYTVSENKALAFTLFASDPDGDTLQWETPSLPSGATFSGSNSSTSRSFRWTPNYTQSGSYVVTFKIKDNGNPSLSDSVTITINVTEVNRAPSLTVTGVTGTAVSIQENQKLTLGLILADADGDSLSLSTIGLPQGSTITPSTGSNRSFEWTPTYDQAGTYTVTFTVTDSGSPNKSDSFVLKITVLDTNRAPKIVDPGSQTVKEGEVLTFALSASDEDGNTLSWKITGLPAGASVSPSSGNNRTFSWKPNFTQEGVYSVTVSVEDNGTPNLSKSISIKITVTNSNQKPQITSSAPTSGTEDQTYTYVPSVKDSDTNDTHSWFFTNNPTGATIDATTGKIEWTPGDDEAGKSFAFSIEVCDSGTPKLCDSQSWQVQVQNINDKPVAKGTPDTTATEDVLYSFKPTVQDDDKTDTHSWRLKKGSKNAKVDSSTGELTWTPNDQDVTLATIDFELEVCDQSGACDSISWTVTVKNVNDAPIITSIAPTQAEENKTYTYKPKVSDPDPNETFTWKAHNKPASATFDTNTGEISWTPGNNEAGKSYGFWIEVCDAAGVCADQKWTVVVDNKNDAPVLSGTPSSPVYVGVAFQFQPLAVDPDSGDTHSWKLVSGPTGMTVDATTGEVKWTPTDAESNTTVDFEVEVCDNGTPQLCATKKFSVQVQKTCLVDSVCPTNQICVSGNCQEPKCSKDSDCSASEVCVDGTCQNNFCYNASCASNEYCHPIQGCLKTCAGVQCASGEVCVLGQCKAEPCNGTCQADEICKVSSTGSTCEKNVCGQTSCKQSRICSKGLCVEDLCGKVTCSKDTQCVAGHCVEREKCAVDVDCPQDQICNNKRCYPAGCYKVSCAINKICIQGSCENNPCLSASGQSVCSAQEFCRTSDTTGKCAKACAGVNCASGEKCVDGQCIVDLCSSLTCSAGQICINGTCEKENCNQSNVCKTYRVCSPAGNKCTDDPCAGVQCPDARQICKEGQCVSPPSCLFDVDCPGAQICAKGVCSSTTCKANKDCNTGELCEDGKCVNNPCYGKVCNNKEFCKAGICVPSCAGAFCSANEICREGKCIPNTCHQVTCNTGEICNNGVCAQEKCTNTSCKNGRECQETGCIEAPCGQIKCPTGQTCQNGQCTGQATCSLDKDCPANALCVAGVCSENTCLNQSCSANQICVDGKCIADKCANSNCNADEICQPLDGKCYLHCPKCPVGQKCVDGKCLADPCAQVQCQQDESCVIGQCIQDRCKKEASSITCKSSRLCFNNQCKEDPCAALTCPQNMVCSEGMCHISKSSETTQENVKETTQENIVDAGKETIQENVKETTQENIVDAGKESIPEKDSTDKTNVESKPEGNVTDKVVTDKGNGDYNFAVTGGCACDSVYKTRSIPFFAFLLFFLTWFVIPRRKK